MLENLNAQQRRYERGDRVKHRQRPEWGVGTVTKAEDIANANVAAQRIAVRFPNAGLKTLNTKVADIEIVIEGVEQHMNGSANGNGAARSRAEIVRGVEADEEHWLAPVAEKEREQALQAIPEAATDPFSGIRSRVKATFELYRFDQSGKGLMDWAIAQTGIEDPLSTYTRHELEEKFDRWVASRDDHLRCLLADDECTPEIVRELLVEAPAAAQQAVQRISARR